MINNIRVSNPQGKDFFISGLFQVSISQQDAILKNIGCISDSNSVYYHPKTGKLYRFCHRGMFGEGFAEEICSEISKEETFRLKIKAKNWNKAKNILLSIPHKHSGHNYVYVGFIAKVGERREKAIERYPSLLDIERLGVDVQFGESSISIS